MRCLNVFCPERPSGQYQIDPDGDGEFTVHCDMELGDGGWTLVMLLDGQAELAACTGFDGTIWDLSTKAVTCRSIWFQKVSFQSPAYVDSLLGR